jgi:hypothetical protein
MAIIANYNFSADGEDPGDRGMVAIYNSNDDPLERTIVSEGGSMPTPGPTNPGQTGTAPTEGQIFPQAVTR